MPDWTQAPPIAYFIALSPNSLELTLNLASSGRYRTMAGPFTAYGHEVTLRTLGLEWDALVYFHSAAGQDVNFLGRRGWLDHVRLGLVHYDESIYLSGYEESSS